jgi:ERCC4-related helicase
LQEFSFDQLENLSIEQRDYQIRAVDEIIDHLPDSILLNYPYGTGKTIIALLTFVAIKQQQPEARFIFTSTREAAALRCRQALELAKSFGFIEYLGYLFDPKLAGKGIPVYQKKKMYMAASVIFGPITQLMNDRFKILRRTKTDILDGVKLCVIDEATDVVARELTGFRLSKYFDELFRVRASKNDFPILAMTGARNLALVNEVLGQLKPSTKLIQRLDISPYETFTQIRKIRRDDYIELDELVTFYMNKPINTIQKNLGSKLSKLEIMKLSYGGILERLSKKDTFPIKVGKYTIQDEHSRSQLIQAFAHVFKLSHTRLLLLDSTPGQFLDYVEKGDMKVLFPDLSIIGQRLIIHRETLPRFDRPEEKTERALLNGKVSTSYQIVLDHVSRGAKVLIFTRYVALGKQVHTVFKTLGFTGVRFLSGETSEEQRLRIIQEFQQGNCNILVFTPVGSRGLNLDNADVVIHLDITTNVDDMVQRRERARGCIEYLLVLEETSEEGKLKSYEEIILQKKE